MLGGFSEEALQLFQLAASEQAYEFSEGEETYDFTRCMRPDGTFYGTGGKCKKGSDAGAKEPTAKKGKKEVTATPGNAANTKKARAKLEAAGIIEPKKEAAPKAPAAKKPRATVKELGDAQRKLYDEAKTLRKKEKELLAEWKRVSTETKGDNTPAGKKARLEAGRKADRAAEAARRAENKWSKAHEKWSKAGERANRAKMTPEQRREARRVDQIIKERG
jgi:hypothetical protein